MSSDLHEPAYNNLESATGSAAVKLRKRKDMDDEYLGDQDCDGDQFDSLERDNDVKELRKTNYQDDDDINSKNACSDPLLEESDRHNYDGSSNVQLKDSNRDEQRLSSTSQCSSHSHFSSSDIPKRETSV